MAPLCLADVVRPNASLAVTKLCALSHEVCNLSPEILVGRTELHGAARKRAVLLEEGAKDTGAEEDGDCCDGGKEEHFASNDLAELIEGDGILVGGRYCAVGRFAVVCLRCQCRVWP